MRHLVLAPVLYVGLVIGWTPRLHSYCDSRPMRARHTYLLAVDSDAVGPVDDCWEIVGAPRTATTEEIRKAYRRRARKLHPDVPGGDPAKFRRLVSAFETLMDRGSRSAWENSRRKTSAR